MEAIQAEIAKDPYNQELIDRRKELLELQQESIIAAENEKEAIKDLVEEGIDKQLESLQDLIDKQGEMLDSQKDYYLINRYSPLYFEKYTVYSFELLGNPKGK